MPREPELERIRLQNNFAAAISAVTVAMNEQFLAIIEGDASAALLDDKIAQAVEKRRLAKEAMLYYIEQHGW